MDPLDEFIDDAEDLIDAMAKDALALHAQWQNGPNRRDLIARMFRNAHTLKGSSAAVELDEITELTQELENLLDAFRSGRTTLDENVLDTVSDTIAAIFEMVGAVGCDERLPVPEELVARLRAHAQIDVDETRTTGNDALIQVPDEIKSTLSESEVHKLIEALREGATSFIIEIDFDLATFDTQFKELSAILGRSGEIVSTQPGAVASSPNQLGFRIVYVTHSTSSEITKMLASLAPIKLREVNVQSARVADLNTGQSPDNSYPVSTEPSSAGKSKGLVRIEVSELDGVLNSTRTVFKETMKALENFQTMVRASKDTKAFFKIESEQIRQRFEKLERSLIELRTVPLDRTLSRAIRAGEAAAKAMGKEIDFEIVGGEVRIDSLLSDAISGPLIHLLRNAVDHGIESPSERASLAKAERGCISLEAVIDDSHLSLKIIDDGRGIDAERVSDMARKRGMSQGQAGLGKDPLRVIFAPGFSTTEAVSELSGRGVGLDVVETALNQLGGKVLVSTNLGVGTTFELVVPIPEHEI